MFGRDRELGFDGLWLIINLEISRELFAGEFLSIVVPAFTGRDEATMPALTTMIFISQSSDRDDGTDHRARSTRG